MMPKIGCDIVEVERFEESAKRGGQKFLDKLFTKRELAGWPSMESLAGIFAAKESVIKALGLKAGEWQKIEINKSADGRPRIKLAEVDRKIIHRDLSISHDGQYAMAVAIFLI